MSDNKTGLIIAIAGIGAALILPKLAKVSTTTKLTPNTVITPDKTKIIDTQTGEVLAQKETVVLKDIPNAQWKVPLFVTIERNIQLGFFSELLGVAQSAGSYIASGGSAIIGNVSDWIGKAGSAVGDAISGISNVVTGSVVPSISSTFSNVAEVISPITSNIKEAGLYVWDLAKSTGSNVWEAVAGAGDYISKNPEIVKSALTTVSTVAGVVQAVKSADQSQIATTPTQVQEQQNELPASQTFQVGLLSQTPFNTEYGESLIVKKLFNPQLKDTALATNNEAVDALGKVGYQLKDTLGYCSPGPFLGSVPMIMLFNESTIDHLLITNLESVNKFEAVGYKSLGTIGYCKGVQAS